MEFSLAKAFVIPLMIDTIHFGDDALFLACAVGS